MHVCTSRLRGRRPAWNGSWRWLASCSFACCLIPIWIMTTLAAQLAIAIENARLYEQIARQETRLERELALARELQFCLLPHSDLDNDDSGGTACDCHRKCTFVRADCAAGDPLGAGAGAGSRVAVSPAASFRSG